MSSENSSQNSLPGGSLLELDDTDYKCWDVQMADSLLHAAGYSKNIANKDADFPVLNWKSLGEKDGVKMSQASTSDSSFYVFRGETIIPASVSQIRRYVYYPQNLLISDPMCRSAKYVKIYDSKHRTIHGLFRVGPLISDRDFCWFNIDMEFEDGTFVTACKSIQSKLCPTLPNAVRGEIRASGYVIQPVKDKENECVFTYVVQSDPKGWLPAAIVNFAARSQAYNPGMIKKSLNKLEKNTILIEEKLKENPSCSQEDDKTKLTSSKSADADCKNNEQKQ